VQEAASCGALRQLAVLLRWPSHHKLLQRRTHWQCSRHTKTRKRAHLGTASLFGQGARVRTQDCGGRGLGSCRAKDLANTGSILHRHNARSIHKSACRLILAAQSPFLMPQPHCNLRQPWPSLTSTDVWALLVWSLPFVPLLSSPSACQFPSFLFVFVGQ